MERETSGTTKVIAITGPPAAGKSTITGIIEDLGVPVVDTGDEMRKRAGSSDEDDVWEFVKSVREEHGPEGPTKVALSDKWFDGGVVCVSGLREQAEVEYLHAHIGPTLVIRVDTSDPKQRTERYVESRIGGDEVIPETKEQQLREELYDREVREMPYPNHDLRLNNDDDVSMTEIMNRVENIIEFAR